MFFVLESLIAANVWKPGFKPGSHIVVIVVIIGNHKQVQANSEKNLTKLLQLICSL